MGAAMRSWNAALLICLLFHGVLSNLGKTRVSKRKVKNVDQLLDLEAAETSSYIGYIPPYWQTVNNIPNIPADYFPGVFGPPANATVNVQNCGDSYTGKCAKTRYRSYDGSCNNLHYPTWGATTTRFARLLPAKYADGVHVPTVSITGEELPEARRISLSLFPVGDIKDKEFTLVNMQWGQIVVHDTALADGSSQSKPHETTCCTHDGQIIWDALDSPLCYLLPIPKDDPDYKHTGVSCINFVRTTSDIDRNCSSQDEPADQINSASSVLDASHVYGQTADVASQLRMYKGGRLKYDVRDNRQWLPSVDDKRRQCENDHDEEPCYLAGDIRVNQNPQLSILQTIQLREHNRIAAVLEELNPHWSDETIFQETRRIVIAEHQYITYYEWLPLYLGAETMYKYKLIYDTDGYVNDYNPSVNPSVLNEHTTAAFRYFHSLIAGQLKLVKEDRWSYDSLRLSDHFDRPAVIEEGHNFDDLVRGLATQPEEQSDDFFDVEIKKYLFRNNSHIGQDLRAIDVQRNRDHGLASYNDLREYCGLKKAVHWEDFGEEISEERIELLRSLYASVDDVDLTVGGSLEAHVNGTLAGPTFLCILVEQFYRTRVGDRFWFETGDPELAFTIEQLNEIRKSSMGRLMCDNGDKISSMQLGAFAQLSPQNSLVWCNSLPAINLSLWQDDAGFRK